MSPAGWYWLVAGWAWGAVAFVSGYVHIGRAFDAGYRLGIKHCEEDA